jgi:hypothetical protein
MYTIAYTIAFGVAFPLAVAALIDVYFLGRKRWIRSQRRAAIQWNVAHPQERSRKATVAGVDAKGDLTIGAKYAIWDYMFKLFAVGGAIIAIVSGIAGYMIKDLANEKAIQVALNNMNAPLAERLAQFADAKSALTTAANEVRDTPKFENAVAAKLSEDDKFQKKIVDREGFQKSLADLLATQHAASVAAALNNDGVFRTKVAELLATQHAATLKGPAGDKGPAGPAGPPGPNGASPSAASVAEALNNDGVFRTKVAELLAGLYADKLKGTPGRDGKDAASLNAEEVASILINKHGDRLQQLLAPKPRPSPEPRRRRG